MYEVVCKYCKERKFFDKQQDYVAHTKKCEANPDPDKVSRKIKILSELKNPISKYTLHCKKCNAEYFLNLKLKNFKNKKFKKFCSRACANSRIRTKETKDKISKGILNSEKFKKAMSSRTKTFYIDICLYCKKDIFHTGKKTKKYHKECVSKISGGYRENSTKVNRCIYNGIKLDSGLEKLFVVLLDKANIKWHKNNGNRYFEYKDKNEKVRKYYPDFYLPEYDLWIETKGGLYKELDRNYDAKINAVENLEVLFNKDVKDLYSFLK